MSKLLPIAELIKGLLELEFKEEAKYTLESKKDWLLNMPDKDLYKEFWEDISDVYSGKEMNSTINPERNWIVKVMEKVL